MTLQVWRVPDPDDAEKDAHGNASAVPVRVQNADEDGWALAPPFTPTDVSEPFRPDRDLVVDVRTGYRQSTTALRPTDEVEWGEGRFKVEGEPARWPNPWAGGIVGSVIRLERASG